MNGTEAVEELAEEFEENGLGDVAEHLRENGREDTRRYVEERMREERAAPGFRADDPGWVLGNLEVARERLGEMV